MTDSTPARATPLRNCARWQRWPDVLAAAIGAVLAAQLFGRYAQRFVTTSVDLQGLRITGTSERRFGRWRRIKVATRSE